jgi:hypothetical protein
MQPSIGHEISTSLASIFVFKYAFMHYGWKIWPHYSNPKFSLSIYVKHTWHYHPCFSAYSAFILFWFFSSSRNFLKASSFLRFYSSATCCFFHLSEMKRSFTIVSYTLYWMRLIMFAYLSYWFDYWLIL